LAAALLGICLTCTVTGAEGLGASSCVWAPVTDAQAVRTLLDEWAAATNLPPFDQPPWDLSIDGGRVRVLLHFARGTLTLASKLDDACEPSVTTIEASSDYEEPLPDEAAVKRLVASDPYLLDEQFPVPAWIVPTIHRLAIRHSAVYRTAMGVCRRFDRSQPAFSSASPKMKHVRSYARRRPVES
jgi:hypothetical protein